MTKLNLIRHAEADGNLYRVAQGQDDSGVTERGLRQLEALRARFADVTIDAAYASDLYRTCRTAAALCAPRDLPLHRRRALREICVGDWERRPWGEIYRDDPVQMLHFLQKLEDWSIPGGESPRAVQARMLACLQTIARENRGKTVAVFSHGCAIRLTMAAILGKSVAQLSEIPLGQNTAVSLLEWEGERFSVRMVNDASHLEQLSDGTLRRWRTTPNGLEPGLFYRSAEENRSAFAALTGTPPRDIALLGCLPEDVVGALCLKKEGDSVLLEQLIVGESRRCRGYGTQLLGQAVLRGRELGCTFLRAVPETEEARRFLRQQGFSPAEGAWQRELRFPPLDIRMADLE